MKKVETYGNTINGKHLITRRDTFMELWAEMGDGKFKLTVEKVYGRRSIAQNDYLHGYLIKQITELLWARGWSRSEIGYEETKTFLKNKFLKREITNPVTGETMEKTADTHELTTLEMNTLFDEIINWATEEFSKELGNGVCDGMLYYPGEQSMMNF